MTTPHRSLSRELEGLWARWRLRRCQRIGAAPTVLGRVWIHGDGQVQLGDRVVLDGRLAPIELHAMAADSLIVLGDDVAVEGGASLEALQSIRVGPGARLGAFCKVMDNQHHPLRGNRHERPPSVPLVIEAGVTVGSRAILLPGTQLQKGCSVAPGTVISRRIPAGVTVGGAPARVLRREVAG
ncbi:acetyltransferase [Myxococcus sp. K15C18031901]|uniref:acyltransferase n=1 Tax=Myxococcus dinghuensis TaxID=2906761 RepID=UPI0020A80D69|nr:acetyltransferase [Myxococcus dinghuensis]MCP3101863.1 acetyltransferase [Myxococcus dinghuensis]